VVGILIAVILAVVIGIHFEIAKEEHKNRVPTPVSHLASLFQMADGDNWSVTITRRSGYESSAWVVPSSKYHALDFAIGKLRQARIDIVEIISNAPNKLEVRAFYDSTGLRRTGKYIGGFIITPQQL
jgi:hypothetical protein